MFSSGFTDLGMPNKPPLHRPFYPMMYSEVSGFGTVSLSVKFSVIKDL